MNLGERLIKEEQRREVLLRQGKVVSIQTGPPRTCTVLIGATNFVGIRVADHVNPVVNEGVWISDMGGGRWIIIATNSSTQIRSQFVLVAGDTMTGALVVPNASADGHALNRITADGRFINTTGDTYSGTHNMGGTHNFTGTKQVGGVAAKLLVLEGVAECSAALTTSTAAQDIPGATTGALALVSGDLVRIWGTFDATHSTAAITMIGTLDIGGVEQSGQALFRSNNGNDRANVAQLWRYTAPSTGNYTFKLRGRHSSGAPTGSFGNIHTRLSWEVFR